MNKLYYIIYSLLATMLTVEADEKVTEIFVDLDGDKRKDKLVMGEAETFGNSGGMWTVFLNRKGGYKKVGEVFAHPEAISFEYDYNDLDTGDLSKEGKALCRIWTYSRINGRTGSIGYYVVREKAIKKRKAINLYVGDPMLKDDLGAKMYKSVFEKSPVPFELVGGKEG